MSELTYKERQRYSDKQVVAEMERLGLPTEYPVDSDFTASDIRQAIAKLGEYETHSDVATLAAGDYPSSVLNAFAALAKALNANITTRYGELKIRRERTAPEKRESALANLKSRLSMARKDEAIQSLMTRGIPGDNAA
jgi:hypothetical protein